jgi:hypothetical protein
MIEPVEHDAASNVPPVRPPRAIVGVVVWALMHLLVTWFLLRGANSLFLAVIYAGLSWLVALPIVAIAGKTTNAKYRLIALWFIGPVLLFFYAKIGAAYAHHRFEQSMAEVRELCDKYGGERIYRTVDNVEGVFQIVARDPDSTAAWADQNAEYPWATIQGDAADMRELVNPDGGFLFLEQQPDHLNDGPPFKRTTWQYTADPPSIDSNSGKPVWTRVEVSVGELRSRYGYRIEDRTTAEMRAKWIGGGAIQIVDIETNEVLAERTGYYMAVGSNERLHWAPVNKSLALCSYKSGIRQFLQSVLKPIRPPSTA